MNVSQQRRPAALARPREQHCGERFTRFQQLGRKQSLDVWHVRILRWHLRIPKATTPWRADQLELTASRRSRAGASEAPRVAWLQLGTRVSLTLARDGLLPAALPWEHRVHRSDRTDQWANAGSSPS